MGSVNAFITDFLKALFCSSDIRELDACFAKDVCAICSMTGKKGIGREKAAALIRPYGAPFSSCEIADFEITNPSDSVYCAVCDCHLLKAGSDDPQPVGIAMSLLENGDAYSIIQIQASSSVGSAGVPEYQRQVLDNMSRELAYCRKQFDAASQHCGLSLWEYDIQKRCISQKENSLNMHGMFTVIENVPDSLIESGYVYPDSAEEFRRMYCRLFAGDEMAGGVFRVKNADGTGYWWEKITYITEFDDNRRSVRAIGFSTDVSERILAQQELSRMETKKRQIEQRTLLSLVIDFTADRIMEFDANRLKVSASDDIRTSGDFLLLLSHYAADPSQLRQLKDMLDCETLAGRYEEGDRKIYMDFLCEHVEHNPVWVQLVLHMEKSKEDSHLIGSGYIEDIDKRKRVEIDLKSHAEKDDLTQVFNRKTFQMLADNKLSERNRDKLVILGILDIDDFKSVNDCYGHNFGDCVLQKVADSLKMIFCDDNFAGRLGGDEFVFAFSDFSDFPVLGQKLNDLIGILKTPDDIVNMPVYVSIGIAAAPWDGNTFADLYKKADQALYQVKDQGKNDWQIYQKPANTLEHERWTLQLSKYRNRPGGQYS